MPIDIVWRAGLGSWGLAGKRPAPRTSPQASITRTTCLPAIRAKRLIGVYTSYTVLFGYF